MLPLLSPVEVEGPYLLQQGPCCARFIVKNGVSSVPPFASLKLLEIKCPCFVTSLLNHRTLQEAHGRLTGSTALLCFDTSVDDEATTMRKHMTCLLSIVSSARAVSINGRLSLTFSSTS